jgi:uncharacterized membrane protein
MTTQVLGAAPPARVIHTDRPWLWLARGWQDLLAHKRIALGYGAALTVFGWILASVMLKAGAAWAILPATAGFFLMAPLLAAGLYEVSRRRELGQPVGSDAVLAPFRRQGGQLAFMGALLLIVHLAWVRVAGLLFALFFHGGFAVPMEELPFAMLQSPQFLPFLIVGTGLGFIFAAATFAACAVGIPALVARDISVGEAISLSARTVMAYPRPMILWAGLIVVFTGLGLVPFFLGLVVAMPLIGHASWHAYRDLVEG